MVLNAMVCYGGYYDNIIENQNVIQTVKVILNKTSMKQDMYSIVMVIDLDKK